ncbi:wall-associated receptor kinase 2-like [Lolium perenne]|uniref:wall-associated receptor kinase 2-like n=1 Tax=Lolium perenne TaxID=4522 RepID=UPI003A98F80C
MALLAFHLTGVGALVPPAYCTRVCGGVKIPYPFGIDIEDGCQLNETQYRQGFKLACRDFNGGRGKRLYYYNNELLDISLENGQVRWLNNISSYCYDTTTGGMEVKSPPAHLDLNGAIFRLSYTANKFTVIGCNTLAYVGETANVSSYTAVCGASCKSSNLPSLATGACEGIGCCQTAIPKGQENYHVWFDQNFTKEPEKGITNCSYAALVEESNFTFSASYLTSPAFMDTYGGQAPLVLDWAVGTMAGETCEKARAKPESYGCVSDNSECVDSPIFGGGYFCNCSQGYKGNPYLQFQGGCQATERRNARTRTERMPASTPSASARAETLQAACVCRGGGDAPCRAHLQGRALTAPRIWPPSSSSSRQYMFRRERESTFPEIETSRRTLERRQGKEQPAEVGVSRSVAAARLV